MKFYPGSYRIREGVTIKARMPEPDVAAPSKADFYCPLCRQPVVEPLVCGDCRALICRQCGTVLEKIDDLGIG